MNMTGVDGWFVHQHGLAHAHHKIPAQHEMVDIARARPDVRRHRTARTMVLIENEGKESCAQLCRR